MSPILNSRIGIQVKTYQSDLIHIEDSSIGDHCIVGTFTEILGSDVGEGCEIGSHVRVSPRCKIGDGVKIGHGTIINEGVIIGNNANIGIACSISSGVTIPDSHVITDNSCIISDCHRKPDYKSKPIFSEKPALSSDHPAYAVVGISDERPYQKYGTPIQLSLDELFEVATDEGAPIFLGKSCACKGKAMAEPRSDESDPLGLGILK